MALAVVVLSVTAVQAVPTTYVYTGNPFTDVSRPYTTSDFVSGMVTLAGPLAPNFSGTVTPTAFTFSDGVQTLTNLTTNFPSFMFVTGPTGMIVSWATRAVEIGPALSTHAIGTSNIPAGDITDGGFIDVSEFVTGGFNTHHPGVWSMLPSVADTGSTLLMLSLTLIALGVAARQFKRAAAA